MKNLIKFVFVSLTIIVIYICTSLSPILFFNYSEYDLNSADFNLIAHRGAAEFAPENTISSVKKAMEFNPDRIEIDVQQTKDSEIILMHDLTLDRTTNGSGIIKDFNYSEIANLDAGSWFSNDFQDEKIPTLEQIIKLVRGRSELIIEIKKGKEYYPQIEKNILRIVNENDASDWVIIHSFDTAVLKEINQLNPKIPIHKLFFGKLSFTSFIVDDGIESFDFEDYPFIDEYSLNYNFANKRIISKIHDSGKKINVWTVNDKNSIKELVALGVDGIITDNPNLIYVND